MEELPGLSISEYGRKGDLLGKGSFGEVYKFSKRRRYAIKFVRTNGDDSIDDTILLEASIMASLNHPNVIKLIDGNFTGGKRSFIVMPLAEYTMDSAILKTQSITVIDSVIYQLLRAVAYIHRKDILHKDIKPPNIFLNRGVVWLADFGLARTNFCHEKTIDEVGFTLWYRSPEALVGNAYSEAADVWSTAISIIEMVTGGFLFPILVNKYMLIAIFNELGKPNDDIMTQLAAGPKFSSFDLDESSKELEGAVHISDFKKLVPFSLYEIVMKMLDYDPKNRITAFDAMNDEYFAHTASNIERELPAPEPVMSFSCTSKLDDRVAYPEIVSLSPTDMEADNKMRYWVIAAPYRIEDPDYKISPNTVSLALYLMDLFNIISDGLYEYHGIIALKVASGMYNIRPYDYDLILRLLDVDVEYDDLPAVVSYEKVLAKRFVTHLTVSTSYMYMVEYANIADIASPERLISAEKVLNAMLLDSMRFTADPSSLGISALYVSGTLFFDVPETLMELVENVSDVAEYALTYYKKYNS